MSFFLFGEMSMSSAKLKYTRPFWRAHGSQYRPKSKRRLNTPHIVLAPISLRRLLLPHRHTLPLHIHHSNGIDIILLELDLQRAEMALRPLRQPPLLLNVRRLFELDKFAGDVAAEDLEFAAGLRAVPGFGRCTGEGCYALWVGEGFEQLLRGRAEFLLVGEGCDVDFGGGDGCGGEFGFHFIRLGDRGAGHDFGRAEAGGWIRARSMLDVFAVFLY